MSDNSRRGRGRVWNGNRNHKSAQQNDQQDDRRREEAERLAANMSDVDKNLFHVYQAELDDCHDRYERIVKISRDVTIESKRIIFQIHRVTTAKSEEQKKKILSEAENRLDNLRKNQFWMVANEMKNLDQYHYQRSFTFGIQEYIEACSFLTYLLERRLITWTEIRNGLTYPRQDNPENSQDSLFVQVSLTDYLNGIGDLGGELMRYAINSISAGDLNEPQSVTDFMRQLYNGCVLLGNSVNSKDFTGKLRVFRESLIKVETAMYTLTVRRSEFPEHMLVDFITQDNIVPAAASGANFDTNAPYEDDLY